MLTRRTSVYRRPSVVLPPVSGGSPFPAPTEAPVPTGSGKTRLFRGPVDFLRRGGDNNNKDSSSRKARDRMVGHIESIGRDCWHVTSMAMDGEGKASFPSPDGRFDLAVLHESKSLSVTTSLYTCTSEAEANVLMKKALELNYLAAYRQNGCIIAIDPGQVGKCDPQQHNQVRLSLCSSHILSSGPSSRDDVRGVLERFIETARTVRSQLEGAEEYRLRMAPFLAASTGQEFSPTRPDDGAKDPSSADAAHQVGHPKKLPRQEMTTTGTKKAPHVDLGVPPPPPPPLSGPPKRTSSMAPSAGWGLPQLRRNTSSNSVPAGRNQAPALPQKSYSKAPLVPEQSLSAGQASIVLAFQKKAAINRHEALMRKRAAAVAKRATADAESMYDFDEDFVADILRSSTKPQFKRLASMPVGSKTAPPPPPSPSPSPRTPLISNKTAERNKKSSSIQGPTETEGGELTVSLRDDSTPEVLQPEEQGSISSSEQLPSGLVMV